MDEGPDIHYTTWEPEEYSLTFKKGCVPAELRGFEMVLQCDIEELPATEEVKFNFRRVIICEIGVHEEVQDATKDDADLH